MFPGLDQREYETLLQLYHSVWFLFSRRLQKLQGKVWFLVHSSAELDLESFAIPDAHHEASCLHASADASVSGSRMITATKSVAVK